ncbi:MAG: hypothetical protein U0W40_15690 [Acidimicrobiia bacterium]
MGVEIIVLLVVVALIAFVAWNSFHSIGAAEVGLVAKRFAFRKLTEDNPIAFRGEAGYQAALLMPGLRFKLWPMFRVQKFPWVQVPAGEIGVVIAQVGAPLPIGAKSAVYRPELANFSNLANFVEHGGQKGVQRPVLPPGTLVPIHPVAFLVLTTNKVYGIPVSPELAGQTRGGALTPASFGLSPEQLRVVVIAPESGIDMVGVVTALEGEPLPSGDIASRLGGFADIAEIEAQEAAGGPTITDAELIDRLLGSKNNLHNNYQDYQAFMDAGGKIGLQHDPLLYGAYLLNPFLVRVELVPMLVVNQGEVAVVKGFVGLPTADTSGEEFKFGSIVRPGHRGIWTEPLRTGKYAINPRVYAAEIVPTFILTLNWAEASSEAHDLDAHLSSIVGKSREGFVFEIDLQVQIHVPDTRTQGDLDGRHDAQPRERGAAERGGQPLPQHAAGTRGGALHRDPPGGAERRVRGDHRLPQPVPGGDEGRLHPGRRVPRGARGRAHPARDRQPGEGDVRGAAARRRRASRWSRRRAPPTCSRSSPPRRSACRSSRNEAQA